MVEPGVLSTDCSVLITHAKKKKKIVSSFPSRQPDGDEGQPLGMEDEETSKNKVGNNIHTQKKCWNFPDC